MLLYNYSFKIDDKEHFCYDLNYVNKQQNLFLFFLSEICIITIWLSEIRNKERLNIVYQTFFNLFFLYGVWNLLGEPCHVLVLCETCQTEYAMKRFGIMSLNS